MLLNSHKKMEKFINCSFYTVTQKVKNFEIDHIFAKKVIKKNNGECRIGLKEISIIISKVEHYLKVDYFQ